MTLSWRLETRDIKSLRQNPKNPRRISNEQAQHLKTSIEKFGVCQPIVITQDGLIIGGHQRVQTLKRLKNKAVAVYVPNRHLEEKEIEELTIRLNANLGDFDDDILANEWNIQDLIDWGIKREKLLDEKDDDRPKKYSIIIQLQNEEELAQYQQELSKNYPYLKLKAKVS